MRGAERKRRPKIQILRPRLKSALFLKFAHCRRADVFAFFRFTAEAVPGVHNQNMSGSRR